MLSFAALADPTRLRIVELLAVRERTAGEIVGQFTVTAPAISQHLKILRDAQLVTVRAEGQRRIHSLNRSGIAEIETWVKRMKSFWNGHLDSLERQLARDAAKDHPNPRHPHHS